MKVRATARGYYGGMIREPGTKDAEFSLTDPKADFASSWMEKIGKSDPLDHDSDGKKGGSMPSGKPSAAERIAQAKELTGRDDITTAKEADAILAAAGDPAPAAGDPTPAVDEPAPFSDDTPIEAVDE